MGFIFIKLLRQNFRNGRMCMYSMSTKATYSSTDHTVVNVSIIA